MKLFGGSSKKGSRAISKKDKDDDVRVSKPRDTVKSTSEIKSKDDATKGKMPKDQSAKGKMPKDPSAKGKKWSKKKRILVIAGSVAACIVFLLGATFAVVRWEVQPFYDIFFPRPGDAALSETRQVRPIRTEAASATQLSDTDEEVEETAEPEVPMEELSNMNMVTFLILGDDAYGNQRSQGGGNTDVVMVAAFDMEELTLEIASIPRDTIVNVPWAVKKINSIWAAKSNQNRNSDNRTEDTIEEVIDAFSDFLGFHVDYVINLNMRGFEALVNAMPGGGVKVNVPRSMSLDDGELGINVRLSAGEQVLNGRQALALVRNRGYGDGDFARVEAQQAFMKGLASQLLSRGESLNVAEMADLLLRYVRTNMDAATMVRIGREAMKLSSENINFSTAEITPRTVAGGWYGAVNVDQWLEIVNTKLSPFYHEITPEHVSILTLDENGRFYVTDDNWQASKNWGSR